MAGATHLSAPRGRPSPAKAAADPAAVRAALIVLALGFLGLFLGRRSG